VVYGCIFGKRTNLTPLSCLAVNGPRGARAMRPSARGVSGVEAATPTQLWSLGIVVECVRIAIAANQL
jgi:hypothetical protein